ncbi:M56 family metallopeptidase, partial [Amycolatopsis minnesotensis]|uniref:M56 family metallopeptidase n=1 Tax=Amycolatopsis minnesotensis TaxID=337894 RepID=UPI0031D3DBF8
VLAHELAHLRRLDHWVNILQTAVETLFFYHPVVRWVSRDLRIEREIACDAMAATLTGDRVGYAETLLKLEQSRGDRNPLAMAMADGQVASRVRRLPYPGRRQGGAVGLSMAALTLVVSALAFGFNDLSDGEDDSLRTAPQPAALEQSLLEQDTQTLTSDGNSGIEASGASSEAPALTGSTSSPLDTVDPIAEAED